MSPLRYPAKARARRSLIVVSIRLVYNGLPRPGQLTAFPTEKASSRCLGTQQQTHSGRGGIQGVAWARGFAHPRPVGAAAF
jgi:hypothetical protein